MSLHKTSIYKLMRLVLWDQVFAFSEDLISILEKGLMIMNSQVPEFTELPLDVKFRDIEVEDVCPLLAEIEGYFKQWSPESYEGYFLPCAISTVSIISAGRVLYSFGGRQATPLYILLVDSSGLSAKTSVMKLIREIIKEAELDFLLFPDTITAQKLFSSMCIQVPQELDKKDREEQKRIAKTIQAKQAFVGQRGWIYDEFGTLIREMMQNSHHNSSFRELLKRLFDNREELGNSTISRDDEVIHYPFLSILGGMTPKDLLHYARKDSDLWDDGFLARIVFINPPDDFRRDAEFPDGLPQVPNSIIVNLRDWHERLGVPQIQLLPEVKVIPSKGQSFNIVGDVKRAFYAYRNALKDQIENMKEKDLKGNYLRLPDIALRIAVLIASVNGEKEVTLTHWGFAQNTTELWRENLHRLYYETLSDNNTGNSSAKMDPLERIHTIIKEKGPITSREIQQLTHYKAATVEALLEDLKLDGKIKMFPSGKTFRYDKESDDFDVGVDM